MYEACFPLAFWVLGLLLALLGVATCDAAADAMFVSTALNMRSVIREAEGGRKTCTRGVSQRVKLGFLLAGGG